MAYLTGCLTQADDFYLMKLPSMWTRAYFVSTAGNVASSTIQKYIEAQGKN